MKTWLTADEIARLALPGLPESREAMSRKAARDGWSSHRALARPRAGRGGGFEYHVGLLPLDARLAYAARQMGGTIEAGLAAVQAAPDIAAATTRQAQAERDARLALIGAYDAFERSADLPRMAAVSIFARLYRRGDLAVPDFVRATVKRLSGRTLMRWLAMRRSGDIGRLAVDRGAARRGQGILEQAENGEIKVKALALIVRQPALSADHVRDYLIDLYGETLSYRGRSVAMPTVRAFQAALKRWRAGHAMELMALTHPDGFKSRYRASGARAHLVTALNALWEIDASPADVLTRDGRYSLYVCIDVFSRRLTILVTRTPRAEAVALLIRKALIAWGVPERIKTDNGSDFVAKASKRLFAALGIEADTANPFSPEEKGTVERAIGTVQRDLMATLPGFIGHSVADRKVIEQRKAFAARLGQDDAQAFCVDLSAAELGRYCDTWAEGRYAHRPHGGLAGATPFQVAAAWRQPVRRVADEAALALLCAPIAGQDGYRTVGKQGLRIDHLFYLSPELRVGERVFVRLDPADMGRVFVFAEDGETFRAIALAPGMAGLDRAAIVAETRASQKRFIDQGTKALRREARAIKPRDVVEALNRRAAARAGTLVEFPKRAEAHSTPELAAAGSAVRAGRAAVPPSHGEAVPGPAPAADPTPEVTPLRSFETPQIRYRRALGLEARLAAAETLSTEEALWLGGYRQTPEYRSLATLYADFGDQALR
ncbi:DDE-type integrase/transposase/recombinase [Phreatobacter stygius]|uniref:DDE-type integrase/transposase/recombinase n=1 Tax=Phreatobacter stygius TaxID=1940610 RepID=UPI00147707BE|nr:DDE-type integrase/transposase/recombinase [Phreatobacter stygius]